MIDKIVTNSLEETGPTYHHMMEECAELQIACSKSARGEMDLHNLLEEMADVRFHTLKILKHLGLSESNLDDIIIDKTPKRQMK